MAALATLCALAGGLFVSTPALGAAEAPKVEETFVTNVSATSATLQAKLDPGGADTTYRFEDAASGGEYAPVRGPGGEALPGAEGDAGAGVVGVPLEVHVQGLSPDTSYRFRLVASSPVEKTVDGPEGTFTTQRSGGEFALPDGRQWEMVSPTDKHGALIYPLISVGLVVAAASGDGIAYQSSAPTEAEPQGYDNVVNTLSMRGGAASWQTRDLTVPHTVPAGPSIGNGTEYKIFSSDLSLAIVQPFGRLTPCTNAQGAKQPCLSEAASEQTAFLHDNLTGAFTPLVVGCPAGSAPCEPSVAEHANVLPGTVFGGHGGGEFELAECNSSELLADVFCGPEVVAATPDLSHVVLEAEASLATGGGGANSLYEWAAGKLTFIGHGHLRWSHPLSNDGSRVIFRSSSREKLLMRDTVTEETVELNEHLGSREPQFETASADGSKVFFVDGGELYVFEVTPGSRPLAGTVRDLTSGAGVIVTSGGGGTRPVLGASEDGSYVYFVSNGVLGDGAVHGAKPGNCGEETKNSTGTEVGFHELESQTCGLYVTHYNGTEWAPPVFIANLSGADQSDWVAQLQEQPTRVSPSGEWLAFMSQASLTGYDNRDAVSGRRDAEVYLYNASANRLVCASCDPTGARPVGVEFMNVLQQQGIVGRLAEWIPGGFVAANLPGWQQIRITAEATLESYQSRYLSSSGRLFFDSTDALVPQDVNGAEDVYQYEPPGVGGCSTSAATYSVRSDGCVGLISSGISAEESAFLDASESGGDVFFLTKAKLVPEDVEGSFSVYDAHECTPQAPCSASPVSPPPCDTEASCKAAPTPQPEIYGAPSSATFNGAGNIVPSPSSPAVKKRAAKSGGRCPRGRKLRRGRCEQVKNGRRAKRAGGERRAKS